MSALPRRRLFGLAIAAPLAAVLPVAPIPAPKLLNAQPYRYFSVPFTRDAGLDVLWESSFRSAFDHPPSPSFFTLEERRA